MNFKNLKLRIKKNEGFSLNPYRDQLGFYTIGYGHFIQKNEKKYFKKKFNKKHLEHLFELDFKKALKEYKKYLYEPKHKKNEKELLVEMFFQLGPKGVLKFKKMLFYLRNKKQYMVCLEMMDSLWYKQTPKRVDNLIQNYLEVKNE